MGLKEEKTVEDLLCRLLEVSELHGYSKDNRNTDIRHSVSNERHTDIRVFRWFITLFFYSFHLPLYLARWSNDLRMFLSSLLFFIIHLSIFFSLESSIQSSLLSTHPIVSSAWLHPWRLSVSESTSSSIRTQNRRRLAGIIMRKC